jgi:glycosyltransferase involved in cell wall biosynthesis
MRSPDLTVLSIGTDELLFEAGSAARVRQRAYAGALGSLHCIVLSRKPHSEMRDDALSADAATGANRLIRLLRAYRLGSSARAVDIVTVQDPFEVGLVGMLITWRLKVPLHVQLHTDPFAPGFARAHWPLNLIRRSIMGFLVRRAARIRVVSERVKQELQKRYKIRVPISVLPIYVDAQRFADAVPAASLLDRFSRFEKKLLIVSRLEKEKNIALAIRAFAEAAPPESCLIIIGEGSQLEDLKRIAAHWKVAERVLFEGKADPAPYYKLADLLIVPSRYEGYGLVIVEALAAGMPVLSTDVGVAREAGAIVAPPEDFAGALAEWFRNGPLAGQLQNYPYASEEEYICRYSEDIVASIGGRS